VVRAEMGKCKGCEGIVFDGFPRTIAQAKELDLMLMEYNNPIALVLYLEVDEAELFKRIMHRSQISGRTDDNAEVIRRRIEVYGQQTYPLIDYYKMQGKCVSIDGMRTIDEVYADLCKVIDDFRKNHTSPFWKVD
jgi:adenylate kinase